jgi:hypothetical protein
MNDSPKQEPITQPAASGKAIPDPNTDFGDETFDNSAMPQKRISVGGLNEWIFSKMRPKSKVSAKKVIPLPTQSTPLKNPIDGHELIAAYQPTPTIPKGFEIQNGLLIKKKTLAERVRDQIKFPVLKSSKSLINGAALILFAVGAIAIYSELPTHPELVVGILIVSISANIIISNR